MKLDSFANLPPAAGEVPPLIPFDPAARKALELTFREALRLGSRIALMEAGRLVTVHSPTEFLRSADPLASAYVRAFGEGLESAANRGTS